MKISFFILLLAASAAVSNCSKETNTINDPFKNTVWTGEIQYPSRPVENYSIVFDKDGGFEWEELSSLVKGKYTLSDRGKKVTLLFNSGSSLTAEVADGKSLANIEHFNAGGWKMLNSKSNTTTQQELVNTKWEDLYGLMQFNSASSLTIYGYKANYKRTNGGIKFELILSSSRYQFFFVPDENMMKGGFTSIGGFYQDRNFTKQ